MMGHAFALAAMMVFGATWCSPRWSVSMPLPSGPRLAHAPWQPYMTRMDEGLRRPKNSVLGIDVAGIVEAVGAR